MKVGGGVLSDRLRQSIKAARKCECLSHLTKKKVTLYSEISASESGVSDSFPSTSGGASAHPRPPTLALPSRLQRSAKCLSLIFKSVSHN